MTFDPRPVELADPVRAPGVRLVPLSTDHVDGLTDVLAGDQRAFEHLPIPFPADRDGIAAWVRTLLGWAQAGTWVPFAVLVPDDAPTGGDCPAEGDDGPAGGGGWRPVGVTAYLDLLRAEHTLEVGGTVYARPWWAGRVNPSCKYLLLRHAFDDLGAERVALKTDVLNTRSQGAIARLGAVREGVLRSTLTRRDGTRRDTVHFSVLPAEWPRVRAGLLTRLGSPA